MARPSLHDNGQTVVVDLHGLSVAQALELVVEIVRVAGKRGRQSIRFIHGSSTSSRLYDNGTIKHTLSEWLEGAHKRGEIASWVAYGDESLVALPVSNTSDPNTISLLELTNVY